MRVRYAPRAIEDLQDIFAYIEKENPFAAARMIDRIEAVVAELGDIPGMGRRTDKQSLHRFPVKGTPYSIFYQVLESEVAIVHIRHGARRPWTGER